MPTYIEQNLNKIEKISNSFYPRAIFLVLGETGYCESDSICKSVFEKFHLYKNSLPIFRALRELCDASLVNTYDINSERYGLISLYYLSEKGINQFKKWYTTEPVLSELYSYTKEYGSPRNAVYIRKTVNILKKFTDISGVNANFLHGKDTLPYISIHDTSMYDPAIVAIFKDEDNEKSILFQFVSKSCSEGKLFEFCRCISKRQNEIYLIHTGLKQRKQICQWIEDWKNSATKKASDNKLISIYLYDIFEMSNAYDTIVLNERKEIPSLNEYEIEINPSIFDYKKLEEIKTKSGNINNDDTKFEIDSNGIDLNDIITEISNESNSDDDDNFQHIIDFDPKNVSKKKGKNNTPTSLKLFDTKENERRIIIEKIEKLNQNQVLLLRIFGVTGNAEFKELYDESSIRYDNVPPIATLRRALYILLNLNFIESQKVSLPICTNTTLYKLSESGKFAYSYIFGKEPAVSEIEILENQYLSIDTGFTVKKIIQIFQEMKYINESHSEVGIGKTADKITGQIYPDSFVPEIEIFTPNGQTEKLIRIAYLHIIISDLSMFELFEKYLKTQNDIYIIVSNRDTLDMVSMQIKGWKNYMKTKCKKIYSKNKRIKIYVSTVNYLKKNKSNNNIPWEQKYIVTI